MDLTKSDNTWNSKYFTSFWLFVKQHVSCKFDKIQTYHYHIKAKYNIMIHFVHVSISPLRENMSLEPIKIYVVSKEKFENC